MPLIYSICRRMGCRVVSASLAAVLFLTDNLNLIESRLILVDSQLVFLAALSLWTGKEAPSLLAMVVTAHERLTLAFLSRVVV